MFAIFLLYSKYCVYILYRSANDPEEDKSAVLKLQEAHLYNATNERAFYNELVTRSRVVAAELDLHLGANAPNSLDISQHYSFDFAQQAMYPDDPMQPGPIYFMVVCRIEL